MRLNRVAVKSIAVLVVTFTATGSYANCSPMTGMKSAVIKLPLQATADVLAGEEGMPSPNSPNSIVGLWHVVYTAEAQLSLRHSSNDTATAPSSKTSITIPHLEASAWECGNR
jgi:hypothetical protein